MLFNVLAIIAASAASVLAAPPITYPRAGTVWTQGYAHNITWSAVTGTGSFALTSSGGTRTLADNVDLSTGRTVVNVPRVNGGPGYAIRLTANDGSTTDSGSFTLGSPDTPGGTGGASGSVSVTTSTSTTTASGSSTGAGGSASSAVSSISSSASSAASSVSASLSSAISSLSSQASAGASSISSRASSALSSATAPSGSGSGSGASSTSSGSAAIGSASLGDFKAGMAVTVGLLVVSMLGGLTIF